MKPMKTPGVYIVEKDAFPNSIVQVATAVPAFIGHTQKAMNGTKSLTGKPWKISSMAEYESYFGVGVSPEFKLRPRKSIAEPAELNLDGEEFVLEQEATTKYLMYAAMTLFFKNGGGNCYIVSVGDYKTDLDGDVMVSGIESLILEQEPTLVVIPETVLLSPEQSIAVQQQMLMHCAKMQNRFAVLDIHNGWAAQQNPWTVDGAAESDQIGDPVANFRSALGINNLNYGCAYYPWLDTSIHTERDFTYDNIVEAADGDGDPTNRPLLQKMILDELGIPPEAGGSGEGEGGSGGDGGTATLTKTQASQKTEVVKLTTGVAGTSTDEKESNSVMLDKTLRVSSAVYTEVTKAMAAKMNVMAPAAAMVGIYTMVDATRGVWKAPANVSLNSVVAPTVNISHDAQEDLNVDINGKSINAIRPFIGEGVLVWGARTLDGNSLDWRYINVRRTMIMIEESIRLASKAYVFEPNTANTWVTMRAMIENFLTGIWKAGGLAGAVPTDAFSVHVGLGETMTPNDILEGILRITVLLAVTRPAEFIEITFQQQQQRS